MVNASINQYMYTLYTLCGKRSHFSHTMQGLPFISGKFRTRDPRFQVNIELGTQYFR